MCQLPTSREPPLTTVVVVGDDAVLEIEKLTASTALVMAGLDQPSGCLFFLP
jgi:hypothetical protein